MLRRVDAQARRVFVAWGVAEEEQGFNEIVGVAAAEGDAEPMGEGPMGDQALVGGDDGAVGGGGARKDPAGAIVSLVGERDGVAGAEEKGFFVWIDVTREEISVARRDKCGECEVGSGRGETTGTDERTA